MHNRYLSAVFDVSAVLGVLGWPVLQIHPEAHLLVAGQTPGRKVHESGTPFEDASGNRLREWMGVTRDIFYDPTFDATKDPKIAGYSFCPQFDLRKTEGCQTVCPG